MSFFKKYDNPITKKRVLNLFGLLEISNFVTKKQRTIQQMHTLQTILNFVDITKLLPATGQLREKQLMGLELLKTIDNICKQNKLQYFISCGTLLGAKRHKGFVPWDYDVDISMLRDDYERLLPIIKDYFQKTNKDYIVRESILNHFQIRIYNKVYPEVAMDIFPMDKYYKSYLNDEEKKALNLNIKKSMLELCKFIHNKDMKEIRKHIKNITNDRLLQNNKVCNKPILFYGIDYPHRDGDVVFFYDEIFPLKEIVFENHVFFAPNNIDICLKQNYGNYMGFPKNLAELF